MQEVCVPWLWYCNASSFIFPTSWRKFAEMDQTLQLNWKSSTNYLIIVCEWATEYPSVWGPIQQITLEACKEFWKKKRSYCARLQMFAEHIVGIFQDWA